jgi:hypothetical protein
MLRDGERTNVLVSMRALKAVGCAQRDIGPKAVVVATVVGGVGKDGR